MKKIKYLFLGVLLFSLFGCEFKEDFSDKYLYATIYPFEYASSMLYSDYAEISSVYPNGADKTYIVTDKKKEKFAKGEILIYSGVAKEASLARDLLNINSNIKIIDATKGMSNEDTQNEILWLDPSNYLMLCSNIKRSLIDYNENVYIKEKIEDNYKKLNELVTDLDVKLYNIGKNSNYNTILVTNNVFNYLTKYNINVVSIDNRNESNDKSYAEAKKLITDKKIEYIFSIKDDKLNETQEKFISDNKLVKVPIESLYTLSDEERKNEDDYISIMNSILENYKKELYKQKES